jgi:flagellar biosynthesis protein FlhB
MTYVIPALLFSGISMFFNGYTIRYLNLSRLIRDFHNHPDKDCNLEAQISNLRLRVIYIKWIQFFSVLSLLLATLSVFTIFFKYIQTGWILFTFSIISFLISLIISALEIKISTIALNISLKDGGDLRCS